MLEFFLSAVTKPELTFWSTSLIQSDVRSLDRVSFSFWGGRVSVLVWWSWTVEVTNIIVWHFGEYFSCFSCWELVRSQDPISIDRKLVQIFESHSDSMQQTNRISLTNDWLLLLTLMSHPHLAINIALHKKAYCCSFSPRHLSLSSTQPCVVKSDLLPTPVFLTYTLNPHIMSEVNRYPCEWKQIWEM